MPLERYRHLWLRPTATFTKSKLMCSSFKSIFFILCKKLNWIFSVSIQYTVFEVLQKIDSNQSQTWFLFIYFKNQNTSWQGHHTHALNMISVLWIRLYLPLKSTLREGLVLFFYSCSASVFVNSLKGKRERAVPINSVICVRGIPWR